jgi:hypothetical protein
MPRSISNIPKVAIWDPDTGRHYWLTDSERVWLNSEQRLGSFNGELALSVHFSKCKVSTNIDLSHPFLRPFLIASVSHSLQSLLHVASPDG